MGRGSSTGTRVLGRHTATGRIVSKWANYASLNAHLLKSRSFIITLGLLTAVAALTVDLSLPAIPTMVDALDTGLIWVNTMLAGYPQIPLAPHKLSGTGVELGMEGLLPFLKRKSAVIGNRTSAPVGWALGES